MKRTVLLLGTMLFALVLLTACGRIASEPRETPAPVPASAEESAVTPEPPPADVAAGGVLEEAVHPIGEGFYPGGLDDDGRGSDEVSEEYGPVSTAHVELTPEEQYKANLFLSNFAEQFFANYSYLDGNTLERAVDFAHIWCKVNDREAIAYETVDGTVYEALTLEKVDRVVNRYFPMLVSAYGPAESYRPTPYCFFRDDTFYYMAADGEAYNHIAVADSIVLLSDESYAITFTVYEVDIEEYFDRGVDQAYYRLSAGEAAENPSLTRVADGQAVVLPSTYNEQDTYQLLEYATW